MFRKRAMQYDEDMHKKKMLEKKRKEEEEEPAASNQISVAQQDLATLRAFDEERRNDLKRLQDIASSSSYSVQPPINIMNTDGSVCDVIPEIITINDDGKEERQKTKKIDVNVEGKVIGGVQILQPIQLDDNSQVERKSMKDGYVSPAVAKVLSAKESKVFVALAKSKTGERKARRGPPKGCLTGDEMLRYFKEEDERKEREQTDKETRRIVREKKKLEREKVEMEKDIERKRKAMEKKENVLKRKREQTKYGKKRGRQATEAAEPAAPKWKGKEKNADDSSSSEDYNSMYDVVNASSNSTNPTRINSAVCAKCEVEFKKSDSTYGCEDCPRWYHERCLPAFMLAPGVDIAGTPFICNLCL